MNISFCSEARFLEENISVFIFIQPRNHTQYKTYVPQFCIPTPNPTKGILMTHETPFFFFHLLKTFQILSNEISFIRRIEKHVLLEKEIDCQKHQENFGSHGSNGIMEFSAITCSNRVSISFMVRRREGLYKHRLQIYLFRIV